MAAQSERIAGGFILITGLDGICYAVRPQSVGIIPDADECHDETLVQLHGGHVVGVPCSTRCSDSSHNSGGAEPGDLQ